MQQPPALLLIGPTASGKTALAFELATRFPCDIVSVDSAQVFRDMDIGTAKPDAATLARYPHRLIDLITPEQRYSAAAFRSDALREMAEITAAGRIPLLVGGTMLYVKALREGLAELPQADPELRAAIDAEAAAQGWPALHAELARLDPDTAARLKPTDAQRIQRAVEVLRLTGRTLGSFFAEQQASPLPFRLLSLALTINELGGKPTEPAQLAAAVCLHDLGMAFLPLELLHKEQNLSRDERRQMQAHPRQGFELLRRMPKWAAAAEIILQHQEHADGSGYPKALTEVEIAPGGPN